MNNELILKEYKKKIRLLNKYNRKYFNENLSVISDSEYDKIMDNYKQQEYSIRSDFK